jgi:hypothetical protein
VTDQEALDGICRTSPPLLSFRVSSIGCIVKRALFFVNTLADLHMQLSHASLGWRR